jgi:peptidoglycan/LPS O-acetylase OafA/YrhL
MTYRFDIDGLRAIAVLSVLAFHAQLKLQGGFVGVDIFFVISGFLITQILHREISAGRFSYLAFWERRLRRLLPALAVMTLSTAVGSYFLLLPWDLKDLGGALIAQPLLIVNLYYWQVVKRGYFSEPPEVRPLLHTWSLGVEEQFYLLFPLFLFWLLGRGGSRAKLRFGLWTLGGISLALSASLSQDWPTLAFFSPLTRAWELTLGAGLALLPDRPLNPNARLAVSSLGFLAVLVSMVLLDGQTPFPGIVALLPCLGTALIILGGPHTPVNRWLARPMLVKIGQLSYSLYLWHWPVLAWFDYTGFDTTLWHLAALLLTFAFAYLSWQFLEQPFRRKTFAPTARGIFALAWVYAAICVAVGAVFLAQDGFPQNWGFSRGDRAPRNFRFESDPQEPAQDLPTLGSKSIKPTFLLWGDSHAMAVAPAFDSLGRQRQVSGLQLTCSACPPLGHWQMATGRRGRSAKFEKSWEELALQTVRRHQLKVVILSAYWSVYNSPSLAQEIATTRDALRAEGAEVYVLCEVPTQSQDPTRQIAYHRRWSLAPNLTTPDEHRQHTKAVTATLGQAFLPNQILDPAPIVLSWKEPFRENEPLYYDRHHLTDAGSQELMPLLEPVLATLTSPPVKSERYFQR